MKMLPFYIKQASMPKRLYCTFLPVVKLKESATSGTPCTWQKVTKIKKY